MGLFVMRPYPENLDCALALVNLIDKTVLNIDAP